jgi:hypothetical protein
MNGQGAIHGITLSRACMSKAIFKYPKDPSEVVKQDVFMRGDGKLCQTSRGSAEIKT